MIQPLKENQIIYIAGCGKCVCWQQCFYHNVGNHDGWFGTSVGETTREEIYQAMPDLWVGETPTKDDCIKKCCDEVGSYGWRFGVQAPHICEGA